MGVERTGFDGYGSYHLDENDEIGLPEGEQEDAAGSDNDSLVPTFVPGPLVRSPSPNLTPHREIVSPSGGPGHTWKAISVPTRRDRKQRRLRGGRDEELLSASPSSLPEPKENPRIASLKSSEAFFYPPAAATKGTRTSNITVLAFDFGCLNVRPCDTCVISVFSRYKCQYCYQKGKPVYGRGCSERDLHTSPITSSSYACRRDSCRESITLPVCTCRWIFRFSCAAIPLSALIRHRSLRALVQVHLQFQRLALAVTLQIRDQVPFHLEVAR